MKLAAEFCAQARELKYNGTMLIRKRGKHLAVKVNMVAIIVACSFVNFIFSKMLATLHI